LTKIRNFVHLNELEQEEKIEIAGFKANIKDIQETLETINNLSQCSNGCVIQLMNAKAIAGKKHLFHGIIHGLNAFLRGENLANNLGIEICVRVSGQRQISKALDILGLKKGKMDLAAVLINCPDNTLGELNKIFDRDDNVIIPDSTVLKDIYNVSDEELAILDIEDILIDQVSELIVEL